MFAVNSLLVCVCPRLLPTSCWISVIASLCLYSGLCQKLSIGWWDYCSSGGTAMPWWLSGKARQGCDSWYLHQLHDRRWLMQADTPQLWHWQQNYSKPVSWILIIILQCLLTLISIFNLFHGSALATVYHHLIRMEFGIFLHRYFCITKMWKKTDWVLL